MNVTRPDRRIVTFYSFKGGVGRSMALANIAFRLADRNDLDVIVVDWDLEAPGLHRFFDITDDVAATTNGLLEYLFAWREAVEDDAEAPPDATGWLIPVTGARKPQHGSLSLLLAGRIDEGYADRLRGFDWQPFYRFNAGAAAIETLRKQLAGKADMVLIDSRTGVTDAGGVCTVQMPDGVVLITAANDQSFKGIERVGRAIAAGGGEGAGRERAKVWVAVGRAPYLDVPEGESWFEKYRPQFEEGYEAGLWDENDHLRGLRSHRLPHVGRWGFGEQLLDTRMENDDPLAVAYGALSNELLQWAMGKEKQALSHEKPIVRTIEELRDDVEQAEQRGDLARLGGALYDLAVALAGAGELTSAAEMLQKAAGIQLGRGQRLDYAFALVSLGQVLLRQGRFDEAVAEFQRVFTTFQDLDFQPGVSFALGAMATVFHKDTLNDPDTADNLYQSSIDADPENANTLGDYANFTLREQKDINKAEALYERAIEADPVHANNLGHYALFLSNNRKDFDKAENFYRRAIEADPNHADNLRNYALFLSSKRKDFDRTEKFYKRAVEADPDHADNLRNYALFLSNSRKDFDRAEVFYTRAVEAAPKNAHILRAYALFLSTDRKDFDRAEELYKRAIEAAPKHAPTLGAYAKFLMTVRNDFDRAEELYKRAIEAAPKHAPMLGAYAIGLSHIRKDFDRAEELYKRAIEAAPKYAPTLGAYANFLAVFRKDLDKAEELYKRAVEAAPEYAPTLGAYANFLSNDRKDFDKAEELYKRAIEAAPKHANNFGNYAGMLFATGRQTDGLSLLDRAIDAPSSSLALRAECWFYALAHRAPEQRGEALAQLKRLLINEGARSPGWDLSGNVERALSDGHPDAAWLALLADVIGEKAEPAVLEAWPAWIAAG